MPVPGTLTPSAADPEYIGQMMLTMLDEDGAPFDVEPRNVLNRLWQKLRQRGLFPVVAVELEFYLLDRQRDSEGYLQPPCAPGTGDRNTQSRLPVDNLNHFADVLNDIDELAKLQLIPADGAVAEASPRQFEINLYHTDNVLDACDDALALKRPVRLVAEKHKMHATFMAKPYEEHAGSGMHIHISILNNKGENVLAEADGEDSALLKRVLAGMIDLMPASMALLAPNMNSYRRFQPGMYVPTQASRGITIVRWRCAFRVAIVTATGLSIVWPGRTPIRIWLCRPFLPGSSTVWITSYRYRKKLKATGWSRTACRSRSAKAMPCGSLCKTTLCVNYSVSVLAMFITPVKMMSLSSLNV